MKLTRKSEALEHKNSADCTAYEYPLGDNDINGAIIKLSGRYPERGFAMNEISKELVYVIKGQGRLTVGVTSHQLSEGDMALLLPGEKYFFEGELQMLMPCTPAWTPAQHKVIE